MVWFSQRVETRCDDRIFPLRAPKSREKSIVLIEDVFWGNEVLPMRRLHVLLWQGFPANNPQLPPCKSYALPRLLFVLQPQTKRELHLPEIPDYSGGKGEYFHAPCTP